MFLIFVATIFACTKDNFSETKKDNDVAKDKLSLRSDGWRAKLHRATTSRPRDGKYCGCEYCFGICEIQHYDEGDELASGTTVDLVINSLTNKVRIYFPVPPSNPEIEFGIDANIALPVSAITPSATFTSLKSGVYTYYSDTIYYMKGGVKTLSYGYVDVDLI